MNKTLISSMSALLLLTASIVMADNVKSVDTEKQPKHSELTAEQWELSRGGERLVKLPTMQQIVNRWSASSGQVIELQYPGGEEGELWVSELRDWLISLGIPSKYLQTVPGSGRDDLIRFTFIQGGEVFK